MVRWREAGVDEPSAHALLTEYFASRAQSFPAGMGEYRTVLPNPAQFLPPQGIFLVIELDGIDVGCGGIRRLDVAAGAPTRFEVKHLWVQPHARGTGLGRRLLAELESRARALGAAELVLDTNASQATATALYRATGYVDIEPYNENANADIWLGKTL